MRSGKARRDQRGFTFILLLFVVAITGVMLAAAGQWWSINSRRDKEAQLRFAGTQIAQALKSSAEAGARLRQGATAPAVESVSTTAVSAVPGIAQTAAQNNAQSATQAAAPSATLAAYPERLEDLLEDHRFVPPMHHLRRLYFDPMTGAADWVPIREGNAIVGVHSRSLGTPLRARDKAEGKDAQVYADWLFRAGDSTATR